MLRSGAKMNQPLINWQEESNTFEGAQLTSFDIWGGLRTEDRTQTQFKAKDFEYMTLIYSSKNVPIEYIWQCPPPFLSKNDNNVERALNTKVPILHNSSLIEKRYLSELNQFLNRFNISEEGSFTFLVPISDDVESRWKSSLCFSFMLDSYSNPSLFLDRFQNKLIALANKIYSLWLAFECKKFNLYHVRGIFCQNAIYIAKLMAEGFSTKVMAEKLHISRSGVEYHIEAMRQILGAKNRGNLIAELFRKGIID